MNVITKAVFPVAGLGTRFLPATKASPKEMLPVVDKPLIQYAVEEAVAAGITELVFITGGVPSIRSSARMTANGCSPTTGCAHSTACPRPSASCWRT